jgi:uncharacterized protein YraI
LSLTGKNILLRRSILLVIPFLILLLMLPVASVSAQEPTPAIPSSGVIATVKTGTEPSINVRSGPHVDYSLLGSIPAGTKVPAIGRSPGGEWVQIEFPSAPDGTGWVYAYYVDLSGEVPVVVPPPTPTPLITPTADPTLAAQFILPAQPTRKPTFTAPPPLVIPTFTTVPAAVNPLRPEFIYAGIALFVIGVLGFLASLARSK